MNNRIIAVLISCLLLAACETFQRPIQEQQVAEYSCFIEADSPQPSNLCNIDAWLLFINEIKTLPWRKRKPMVQALSGSTSDKLKKILLSQAADTPYQDRLRAQLWIEDILPHLNEPLRSIISLLIQQPNQQVLELESAIVTLSKLNAKHAQDITELQQSIEQHQQQLEQLLKLETNLVEKVREPN